MGGWGGEYICKMSKALISSIVTGKNVTVKRDRKEQEQKKRDNEKAGHGKNRTWKKRDKVKTGHEENGNIWCCLYFIWYKAS